MRETKLARRVETRVTLTDKSVTNRPLMIKVGHGVRGVARNVYPHLSHHGDGALFHRGPPDDPSAGNAYLFKQACVP